MTDIVYKWRVWCNTDSKYVDVWKDVEPSACPENNGHTIDTAKTTIVDEVNEGYPISDVDGKKIAVHPSYKPEIDGKTTYAVWTGAGDASGPDKIGDGDLLHFTMTPGTPKVTKDIIFNQELFGKVWIHEAYLKFTGGGPGDYVSSDVMAKGVTLQQSVNLDLEIYDTNMVKLAAGGPGTGTHGFASTPALIPRSYSLDGDWDYDEITGLVPNTGGTGAYKISTEDQPVHRYVNKIPCFGDCASYFSMSSDETAEIQSGYFLRVDVYNNSDTAWDLSVIMEIYRERTVDP